MVGLIPVRWDGGAWVVTATRRAYPRGYRLLGYVDRFRIACRRTRRFRGHGDRLIHTAGTLDGCPACAAFLEAGGPPVSV